MQAEAIATILTSVFLLLVILGLLFGWWRGYAKSIFRLGLVIGVAVLTFFVVPSISKALLTLDISGLNIVIGENAATNVQELIIALLESIPYVTDLVSSSPAFESILVLLPEAILNIVGFIVFFYLFRFMSMIIFWIVNAIVFPKKKQAGKNKHRMIGAVIGAIQGAVIAIILLLPIYGTINTISPIIKGEVVSTANVQVLADTAYAEGEGDGFRSAVTTSEEYIVAIENSFMTKIFNTIGISKLADIAFEKLTTVKYDYTEFNLKKEVTIINNAYQQISFITSEDIDFTNPEHVEKLDKAVDTLLTSKNLSDVVSEMIIGVAEGWTNPEDPTFMGIKKPELADEDLNAAFNEALLALKDPRDNAVKKDITAIMDAYVVLARSGILTSTDAIETLENNELLITNVLTELVKSPTINSCLPEVLNCALKFGYKSIGFTDEQIQNIGDIDKDAVIDDAEIAILQQIGDDVVVIYDQMNNAPADAKLYEKVNFASLGSAFDNLRKSKLLGDVSLKLVQEMLATEQFVGKGNVEKFADLSTALGNVWVNKDAKLSETFKAFEDAMKVADKLTDNTEGSQITPDDVKDILGSLSNNEAMGDVIDEVVNKEFLVGTTEKPGLGLDEETADVVIDIVDQVVNDPNFNVENETNAAVEIFNTASKIMNAESGTKVTLDQTEQTNLVNALVESESLTKLLAENTTNETLNLKNNLESTTLKSIQAQVDKIDTESGTEEENAAAAAKKAQLIAIFGALEP